MSSVPSKVSSFVGTLFDLLDRVEYRRVSLEDQLDPVYRLRYEAYRREEFIPINSQQTSGDSFDLSPNAMCYGVYVDGTLVSSIRLHHVTPEQRSSPSRSIYPDELDKMLDDGFSYIDPSRFTVAHEASLALPALPFLTLRIAGMACEYFNVDYCLSSVRPEHAAFYKRVFLSKQLAGERYYPGLIFPVCLYATRIKEIRQAVYARYPFFRSTPEEREQLCGEGQGRAQLVRPTARVAQRLAELDSLPA